MSQTETSTSSEEATKSPTSNNLAQVVPRADIGKAEIVTTTSNGSNKKEKGKKVVDPEYVKSPLPATDKRSSNPTASTATTTTTKPFQKGGFLSLLLCCTVGAGSFLDNSDKSSLANSKKTLSVNINRNSRSSQTAAATATITTTKEKPIVVTNVEPTTGQQQQKQQQLQKPSPIITNPQDLNLLASDSPTTKTNNAEAETPTNVESTSPISLPPQTSPDGPVLYLLPPLANEDGDRKCLVLDLDETLVHSSFKIIPNPDFIVPVEIDNQYHNVYVLKRPGVDEFMRKMGEIYEIVVFTASLAKYADPVLDMLDIHRVVKHRLFRESCFNHKGTYVKDLSQLGRDLASTLILDNSPASYIFHTSNAVPVSTWFNDPHDTELTDLVAFLQDLTVVDDVQLVLDNMIDPNINNNNNNNLGEVSPSSA